LLFITAGPLTKVFAWGEKTAMVRVACTRTCRTSGETGGGIVCMAGTGGLALVRLKI
jgi:hypothetical protein